MFTHFRNEIASLELVPSSGGAFEILVDGTKIHSKLETRQYPELSEIIRIIEK
ncbi:Rdx family protein [Planococcus halotolerans]|uniref:SelT/SelW/SelH family protein n=1 Tax=Planococcus halotolerans TaxID=2233542 RepID=A0A365L6R4_9BACL|nr:SelT/SelW/SelH family protein [Planococcus halotolerans]RAZ81075.1 hypothetical protein DP120_01965 [Planococcus halotolerans]